MMDRICLAGIEVYAYGGVDEAEKQVGQRYRVNVELFLDLGEAGRSDKLEDTVSYAEVFTEVVETARERHFNLLESVTAEIVGRLLDRFPVERVSVEVQKLLPPIDGILAYASVSMTRERD